MDLKGSKTEMNLYKTFAGESRARNRYNLYAEKARKEGFQWIAEIFDETALNEFGHAREVYGRYLKQIKNTESNLLDAAKGEAAEAEKIYKQFEETARAEGFVEVADFYKELREVEEAHEERFLKLADMLKTDTLFKSNKIELWQCLNCGYIHEGTEAPMVCPLCKFPRAYFKQYCPIRK